MKNFKYLLLIALAIAIYSCEDESISEPLTQSDTVYVSNRKPITKGPLVAKKYSTVESLPGDLNEDSIVTYKTIKLRNKNHSIMQEWFLENYRENPFGMGSHVLDQYPDGASLGTFYSWANFNADTPNDCNELFSKRGFHIPTERDVENLVALYGDANRAREMLNLQNPDLTRYLDVYYSEDRGRKPYLRNEIFVDPQYLVGPHPENRPSNWGVSVFFGGTPPHDLAYIIPNNEEYCLVRFVRDLYEDEW